jgi:4-hydroxy-3-methylbut-2-en-1-yl diphosphate synthase IspG/GcpE
MQTQLKVIKADGSIEEYLHTKVLGAISNALGSAGQADIGIAEQLADVVTYYLYHRQNRRSISSSDIFSVIKAVLASINYEDAAIALTERHFERKLKRSRIEVVRIDVQELEDAELLARGDGEDNRGQWDKSRIVEDLVTKYDVSRQTARTIASMVEEKIFSIGITLVPASLIKQLVLNDAAAVLRAQRQLQTV